MRKSEGFGLVELIIVLVAAGLLVAGVLTLGRRASASFDGHQGAEHIIELVESIQRSDGSTGSYAGVGNSWLVASQLVPSGMEVHSLGVDPIITMAYGGELSISPATIEGQADRGLVVSLADVPAGICAALVGRVARYGFRSITVEGREVLDGEGKAAQDVLARGCSNSATASVVLTLDRGFTAQAPVSEACVLSSPSTQTQTQPCPMGYEGSIVATRSAVCEPGSPVSTWTDWSVVRNCAAQCREHIHSPQLRYSTPCATGEIGTITERRVSVCPASTGEPVWSDWVEVSSTCAPQCMAPADQIDASLPCPSGQSGTIVRRRSATCPAASGPWHWNAWEEVSNTCV